MKRYIKSAVKSLSEEDGRFQWELATDPNTGPRELEQLAQCSDWTVRSNVAKHPNVSVKTLTELSKDTVRSVLEGVTLNPKTPASVLLNLVYSDYSVASNIIDNPNVTAEILDKLADSSISGVRALVAEDTKTLPDTLSKLANDPDAPVRVRVAHNRNTTADTLDRLSTDWIIDVLYQVARNPNTRTETLRRLASEARTDEGVASDDFVQKTARQELAYRGEA